MNTTRIVLSTVTAILLFAAPAAKAEMCGLPDGREFATDGLGDITYPTELVGFRLRERDDMAGFEVYDPWASEQAVLPVSYCRRGYRGFGGQESSVSFKRSAKEAWVVGKGRDSGGGNCKSRKNDDSCNEE